MIFLVKIYVTCIVIFFKAYFLKLKRKKDLFKYKPTEPNVISVVLTWEKVDLYFGQKYKLASRLMGRRSIFRRQIDD